MFQVVVQALIDLQNGRPCDLGLWRRDVSPDFRECRKKEHICQTEAEMYLQSLTDEEERLIGVSFGYINDLVRQIKKRKPSLIGEGFF